MPDRAEDSDLVIRIADGDEAAFDELYGRYRERVFGFAFHMLGKREVAEDATQEAFLALIKDPSRYQAGRGSLLTYLCAITRNQILWHLRCGGHELEDGYDEDGAVDGRQTPRQEDPLASLLGRELIRKVADAIASLPPLQKEALVLREYGELSYGEIAAVTGAEVGVVKMRLHRARRSLARQLRPYITADEDTCHELR